MVSIKNLALINCIMAASVLADHAPENTDSPKKAVARAHLDKGSVKGIVEFTTKDKKVWVHIDVTGLPPNSGPFYYHIHNNPIPKNGDCEAAGTHLNPFGSPFETCDDFDDDSLCQVGDLSGKHGFINTTCFEAQYFDPYLSLNKHNKAFVGGLSVVLHDYKMNKIGCGNINLVRKSKLARDNSHASKTLTDSTITKSHWVKNEGYPKKPRTDYPEEPHTDYPEEPHTDYPEEPHTDYPEEPHTDYPEEPHTDYPEEPHTDYPEKPHTGYPQEPHTDYPEEPHTDHPKEPHTDSPKEPQTDSPKEPQTDSPKEPQTDSPKEPQTDSPKEPQTDSPKEPQTDYRKEPQTDYPNGPQTDYDEEPQTDYDEQPLSTEQPLTEFDSGANMNYLSGVVGILACGLLSLI